MMWGSSILMNDEEQHYQPLVGCCLPVWSIYQVSQVCQLLISWLHNEK